MRHRCRVLGLVLAVALSCSFPDPAQADEPRLFEIWVSGLFGGIVGRGDQGVDLYQWTAGGAAGFEAGVRLLFLAAYVEYLRAFGGQAGANLWSINVGGDTPVGFGEHWALTIRLVGTYYFAAIDQGASQSLDGVLYTSDMVNTHGFGGRFGLGPRYNFARFFSVGVTPQVGYHYFYDGADNEVADLEQHSSGWDFQALAYLRVGLGF